MWRRVFKVTYYCLTVCEETQMVHMFTVSLHSKPCGIFYFQSERHPVIELMWVSLSGCIKAMVPVASGRFDIQWWCEQSTRGCEQLLFFFRTDHYQCSLGLSIQPPSTAANTVSYTPAKIIVFTLTWPCLSAHVVCNVHPIEIGK